jgi:hypothetical protein
MSVHSYSSVAQTTVIDNNDPDNDDEFQIIGSFKESLYEKYDELLIKMDEIIKRNKKVVTKKK